MLTGRNRARRSAACVIGFGAAPLACKPTPSGACRLHLRQGALRGDVLRRTRADGRRLAFGLQRAMRGS